MAHTGRINGTVAKQVQANHPEGSLPDKWDPNNPTALWRPHLIPSLPTFLSDESYEVAVKHLNSTMAVYGFAVTVCNHNKERKTKSNPFPAVRQAYLRCARGRSKDEKGYTKSGDRPHVGSRMCDCPWWAEIKRGSGFDKDCKEYSPRGWIVTVHCDIHNHKKSGDMGLPQFRQLDEAARTIIKQQSGRNDPCGDIHNAMISQGYQVIKCDVQNLMNKYQLDALDGMTPIEALLFHLQSYTISGPRRRKDKYFYRAKKDVNSRLNNLFFAHPASFDLIRDNSNVLLLDCIYKIN
jgi:hypothetical protein